MVVLNERYVLRRVVGRGGMAVVWQAHDLLLERTVAVKMLSDALSSRPSARANVRREAVVASRLNHPHVASVHDYGEHVDESGAVRPYLVLEFVDGVSLTAQLSKDGPLALSDALRVGSAVAEALAAAHAEGLVHRDIKPGNVMLGPAGVKVVDFGVAAEAGRSATDVSGAQWGTPAYLAPEYIRDATATPAGDVFALGLLLTTMLSGRGPDRRPGDDADARLLLPDRDVLPAGVRDVLSRCLATDPGSRPTTAAAARAMRGAMNAVVDDATAELAAFSDQPTVRRAAQPETEPVPGLVARPRPRWTAALPAIMLAVGALALTPFVDRDERVAAEGEAGSVGTSSVSTSCIAEYSVRLQPDGRFAADLRVTNTGPDELRGWSVQFELPAGQHLTTASVPDWQQERRAIRLMIDRRLASGASTSASLQGNLGPAAGAETAGVARGFTVNGQPCARVITHEGQTVTVQPTGGAPTTRRTGAAPATVHVGPAGGSSPTVSSPPPSPLPSSTGSSPRASEDPLPSRTSETASPSPSTQTTTAGPATSSVSASASPQRRSPSATATAASANHS
ncbi:serine/threonine-protein kinase [Dactylosporangium matsuzakiense]|nr:serine/threonine-protein kinase [Dactylosporangium matsuzakiense]UWZ42218.1 protein kinase [Dactylosporangium matsuzakiense]